MKKIIFLTLLTLTTLSPTGARAADASAALQQALFEEEANQNLEAAIKAYQLVIQQTEEQRKLAATAVYRLGECYRKLGRTNEAAIQYKRILSDFADQGTLATLSRQNLAGIGISAQPSTTPSPSSLGPSAEDAEIQRLEKMANESPDLLNATIADRNETPLSSAATKRELKVAAFLLSKGVDVNKGNPLQQAVLSGHKGMVELLLKHGADVNSKNSTYLGYTPLHWAAEKGYKSIAEVLLDHKAEVNALTPPGEMQGANATPLHLAAMKGHSAMVELLLKRGADLKTAGAKGRTALHLAALTGHSAVVALLLQQGAEVEVKDREGYTPLHLSVESYRPEVMEMLLNKKADPNAATALKITPLHRAVEKGQLKMVELLLSHKADVNATNNNGIAALHYMGNSAVREQMVELLLAHGADVNAPMGGMQSTPLHQAVELRDEAVLKLLLSRKPNLEIKNGNGSTPLHLAIERAPLAMARLLLEAGADVNARSARNGSTPLFIAVATRNTPAVKLLLEHKAQVNILNDSKQTPRSSLEPGRYSSNDEANAIQDIRKLLTEAGANETLTRMFSITVTRQATGYSRNVFTRSHTNSWNNFTLLELVAGSFEANNNNEPLRFPDLRKVRITRIDPLTGKVSDLPPVDVEAMLKSDDPKDMELMWGDSVEIPESDHRVEEIWRGLSEDRRTVLQNRLKRTVTLRIKGEEQKLVLFPSFVSPAHVGEDGKPVIRTCWLTSVIQPYLRTSSDSTRVHVKRAAVHPFTGQGLEGTFNLENMRVPGQAGAPVPLRPGQLPPTRLVVPGAVVGSPGLNPTPAPRPGYGAPQVPPPAAAETMDDLWLWDGDVIEVPEK